MTSDQTIKFTGVCAQKRCPIGLRRIGYREPVTGKSDLFLTNNFKLSAQTIADIYKSRWQVELFYKWACLLQAGQAKFEDQGVCGHE